MRLPGMWRARYIARKIRRRLEHRVLILLYHRVNDQSVDPWSLNVTPHHFSEHLAVLQRRCQLMRLQELVGLLQDGRRLPHRAAVVTFDDGYADNLHNAKPILERFACPATVFLSTGTLGRERGFWWDELGFLLQPGRLAAELTLRVNGQSHSWELGKAAHYTVEAFEQHRHWKAVETPPGARQLLYRSLWELLLPLVPDEQRRVLEELLDWAGRPTLKETTYPTLTVEEAVELARGPLIEIGAHTVHHAALAALPPDSQRHEIRTSKTDLERMLNHSIESFSYPYGRRVHFSTESIALVREAGFSAACTNMAGCVTGGSYHLQLPRFLVGDWDGPTFARWLEKKFLS